MVMGAQLVGFRSLPAATKRELLFLPCLGMPGRTSDAFGGRNQWLIGREEDL
jgi:hypothetical protein